MRKRALLVGTAVLASSAAVAYAQQPTPSPLVLSGSGKVTGGAGSKTKPVPVSASSLVSATTTDGSRQQSWKTINVQFGGVKVDRVHKFATCSIDKIAAAQSTSVCPSASLVATGKLKAVIGPEADFSNPGAPCAKDVRIYNAGKGKTISYLDGPGSACAGVGYLPPFAGSWKSGGIGDTLVTPIPSFISHPLPGTLGSSIELSNAFKKLTVKEKGKTYGYLSSVGCKGTRTIIGTAVGDPDGQTYTVKSTGKC